MKTKIYYELWICYGHNKWHDLKRTADTAERICHIGEEIAKEHTKTTKLAIVRVVLSRDTLHIATGNCTFLKPRTYAKCKECGKRRKNKNINPASGVCLVCELRAATDASQADLDLADSERNCMQQP
jgi:predicted house-cleaning NTP pyrophosphatase (Maf/HAM1 superfamily)